MNKFLFGAVVAVGLVSATPSFAERFSVEIPQPVQQFTICRHGAVLAVNDRAIPVRGGQPSYVESGDTATISRTPDVFIQTERVVRNSYNSLSASGRCR